ncbi:MAG: hypothetical protein DHS20C17_10520 [Cyclobacteriaceae bacterium]|nr:MAG: hypothetical protein DHS20C17_10520 [Cyclobacteriaceae bacterium]
MEGKYKMARIICVVLITFILTGFTAGPEPEPVSKSFISVFDNKRKRADRHFNNFEFKSAIKLYNRLVEKGKADDLVKLRLAESYLKVNDHQNAEKWYAEVIHSDQVTPQHQIQYANTLLSNGKYQAAREVIQSYEFADSDYRSQAIINTLDMLEVLYADSTYYQMTSVVDNKPEYSDFSPTAYKNGIVFVSSRHDRGPKFKWDETPFLDLYYTESDVASAVPFSKNLNSKYHEGPIAFYDDYKKAVFTRSNYLDKQLGMTDQGINNLRLYTATWSDSEKDWTNIEPLNFMIANYSYGHPAISGDFNKLYFVSDMPGGFGGTDLYVSERNADGWSEPVNLGEVINTSGNEMYPFLDVDNSLYFASNGHGGLGGLDMFQVKLDEGFEIRNMGYPMNTTADDFGFSLASSGDVAYISSNREGVDNIFKVNIQAPDLEMILADNSINGSAPTLADQLTPVATSELSTIESYEDPEGIDELSTINAKIIDETNSVLSNTSLKLLVNGEEYQTLVSDENGNVSMQVPADQEYTLIANKDGFKDRLITIPAESLGHEEDLLVVMNSSLVDSDHPENQISTELDPLAVSEDGWNNSEFDASSRPDIHGVPLTDVPSHSREQTNELSTMQLDPLAVSDNVLEDSGLYGDHHPEVQGVALSELPEWADDETSAVPTTELDPLAVSEDSWNNSGFDASSRPDIHGVPLTDVPSHSTEQANELSTMQLDPLAVSDNALEDSGLPSTQLDPLAVSDNALEDSGLDGNHHPEVQGVALSELPEWADDETSAVPTTELDPLAVSEDSWNNSEFDASSRPDIHGVPLTDVPPQSTEQANELSTMQLDPLAVSDNTLEDSGLPSTQLDPLAVSDNALEDSGLDGDHHPEVQGVALAELPDWADDETSAVPTTELDPLAVSEDGWNRSEFDASSKPGIQGAPLTDVPPQSTEQDYGLPTTQLDPLATSYSDQDNETLRNSNSQTIQAAALTESINQIDESPEIYSASSEVNTVNSQLNEALPDNETETYLTNSSGYERFEETDLSSDVDRTKEQQSTEGSTNKKLISTQVIDAVSGNHLADAELKLFVDSPNESLDYELRDGVLTFEALPEEEYIIVASHKDYQDQFITLSGEELLANPSEYIDLELSQVSDTRRHRKRDRQITKFKAQVRDQETGALLEDAEVKFFVDGKAVESEYSGENGKTIFKSPDGDDHMMLVSRNGYQDLIYHLTGAPQENMDVELALLKAEEYVSDTPYQQLAVKGLAFDEFSGADLEGVTFTVFENGNVIETTENLSGIEIDPNSTYLVLAEKDGFQEALIPISQNQLNSREPLELTVGLKREEISESSGGPIYKEIDDSAIPVSATVIDITNDQPISEATVIVFADDQIQEKTNTWTTGAVNINVVPGKRYQLVIQRPGYSDKMIDLGMVSSNDQALEIALIPQNIQNLRQSGIDLNNASMLVMTDPTGGEQQYLSTENDLYQYLVENDNHYLIKDGNKILLKERNRSIGSKVGTKQDSDHFNLRSEDQFLYDQLSGDEKAMVDKIVRQLRNGDLSDEPELAIYYNNLPEEYRNLVETMVQQDQFDATRERGTVVAPKKVLTEILAEKHMKISETFNINNIYYDFDKDEIREDAAVELDKLALILNNNQNIRVAMFSHTDSRGSNAYNTNLSKRRGVSAMNYLIAKGISADRFSTEAKGETQLVNSCSDSVSCSEQAHQLNRRTEFRLSA